MFLAYLVDTKTDDVTQPHPMKLAEVNSDLWHRWSWLPGTTWDQLDRHATLRTAPRCWPLDIDVDRSTCRPARLWRPCRTRWTRSRCERTCWVACDHSAHCRPWWSRRWHIVCPAAARGSSPSLAHTQTSRSSDYFTFIRNQTQSSKHNLIVFLAFSVVSINYVASFYAYHAPLWPRQRPRLTKSAYVYYGLLWSPYVIGQTIMFLPSGFFLSSFFPRLISASVDWMSTILRHMVWP